MRGRWWNWMNCSWYLAPSQRSPSQALTQRTHAHDPPRRWRWSASVPCSWWSPPCIWTPPAAILFGGGSGAPARRRRFECRFGNMCLPWLPPLVANHVIPSGFDSWIPPSLESYHPFGIVSLLALNLLPSHIIKIRALIPKGWNYYRSRIATILNPEGVS